MTEFPSIMALITAAVWAAWICVLIWPPDRPLGKWLDG